MDKQTLKSISEQLRRPQGEYATKVGEKMNEGNLQINLYTIEALDLREQEHVLEIGMGNGFFVQNILSAHEPTRYTGCDFSEAMVEEAGKYNDKFIREGRAEFYLADANKLPFGNEKFDKVFTVNTVYFWDNPTLVLSEIRRVLKPKGSILLSIRPKSVMEHYPFVKYGFRMFTKDDLANLLSENDFKVTGILEKKEADQEINGEKITVETLIVIAEK